jgi:hypothetical protein
MKVAWKAHFGWRQVLPLFLTFAAFDHAGLYLKVKLEQWAPDSIATIIVIVLAFCTFLLLSVGLEVSFKRRSYG